MLLLEHVFMQDRAYLIGSDICWWELKIYLSHITSFVEIVPLNLDTMVTNYGRDDSSSFTESECKVVLIFAAKWSVSFLL
jgi:hypothetical protein